METLSHPIFHISSIKSSAPPTLKTYPPIKPQIGYRKQHKWSSWFSSLPSFHALAIQKSLPVAVSAVLLLSANPANAGFMSGFSGIESVPGPELPQIDFLTRFNEENQKKYAENDKRFKSSPILKELLERSKLNKEKNKQAIQDKYCLRGAEWGVGDCSAEGMSPADRENFISMLKEKAGVE